MAGGRLGGQPQEGRRAGHGRRGQGRVPGPEPVDQGAGEHGRVDAGLDLKLEREAVQAGRQQRQQVVAGDDALLPQRGERWQQRPRVEADRGGQPRRHAGELQLGVGADRHHTTAEQPLGKDRGLHRQGDGEAAAVQPVEGQGDRAGERLGHLHLGGRRLQPQEPAADRERRHGRVGPLPAGQLERLVELVVGGEPEVEHPVRVGWQPGDGAAHQGQD